MVYRLAEGVQVRKEGWGLLFYSQGKSKIYFVKSGDRLHPLSYDGTFQPDSLEYRPTNSLDILSEHPAQRLISQLVERGLIVNEP
jgi:putative mycofactocin binding protein MftB